jgi:hypothetical protein
VESFAIKRKPKRVKKEKLEVEVQDALVDNVVKHKNPKGFDLAKCIVIDKAFTSKFDNCVEVRNIFVTKIDFIIESSRTLTEAM